MIKDLFLQYLDFLNLTLLTSAAITTWRRLSCTYSQTRMCLHFMSFSLQEAKIEPYEGEQQPLLSF